MIVNISEAKANLSKLVNMVHHGKKVVIAKNNLPLVDLVIHKPEGKRKEEITLEGRIVTIVDVFDALVSVRPYKNAFSYEETYHILKNGDGRVMPGHFDPKLLALFFEHYDEFTALHRQLKD